MKTFTINKIIMSRTTPPKTPCCYGLFLTIRDYSGKPIKFFCSSCRKAYDIDGKVITPTEIIPKYN